MCANIEAFHRGCALILARLYGAFPRPIILTTESLDDGADVLIELRDQVMTQRRAIYAATVEFLRDEGYLVFGSKAGSEIDRIFFSSVRLTSKGLAALNRTPDSIRPIGQTTGDRLIEWGRGTLGDVTKDALKQLIGAILGS
jgi:hypothetical protein